MRPSPETDCRIRWLVRPAHKHRELSKGLQTFYDLIQNCNVAKQFSQRLPSQALNLRRVVPVPPACDCTMVPVPPTCDCTMVPVPPACDCTMVPVPVRTCHACFASICSVSPKEGEMYACVHPSSHSSQTIGLHLSGSSSVNRVGKIAD